MALQHSFSNPSDRQEELEDLLAQTIPSSITHLEQCVSRVQSQIEHLNSVAVPRTELLTDFALQRTAELDTERNRIRNADLAHARQLAESYLLRFRESERRNAQQRQRLDALETRTTVSESVCGEQMALNRELAEISIRTLRQFAEAERKRLEAMKSAYSRCDSMSRELDRCKSQRDQQEQTIGRLRDNANALNQELSSLTHQINKAESERNILKLERDKFRGEADSVQTLLVEQENTIAGMRERETTAALELRQRDGLVDSLVKERAELEKEMMRTRREFENLLARQEREAEKQLEEKRQEVVAEQRAKHRVEIDQLRLVIRQHKSDFEAAMQEALRETQKLAAQREEYFNNWRQLDETLDHYKQKVRSALSRKMVAKCSELVRDLKEIGGDENGRMPHTPRMLEPVENVAQRFLDEMASGRSE